MAQRGGHEDTRVPATPGQLAKRATRATSPPCEGALAALGRHDEAIAAVRHALELDPLSLSVKSDLGWYYLFAGRWDDATRECRETLETSPGYGWATTCLVEAALQAGDLEEAVRLQLD